MQRQNWSSHVVKEELVLTFPMTWGGVAQPFSQTNHVQRPGYNEVLKKNVPNSQFNRLQKRAAARAEEAKIQTEKSAEQAWRDVEKAKIETQEQKKVATQALRDAAEANLKAEQAKTQLKDL